jgi:hypothetical protein
VGVSGIHVSQNSGRRVQISQKCCCETQATEAVRAGVTVHAGDQLYQRHRIYGKRAQTGMKRGHQQSGGYAFAGDIGHNQQQVPQRLSGRRRPQKTSQ